MNKWDLNPPRGTRDLVKETAELYEYLFDNFREVARLNGFKPVIPPTIEHSKLFEAKSGEEIRRSMYVFVDKAGRTLALRPEVTASVVRIYLSKLKAEPKPLRLYYITQCFRYEEPQKARYREFWQAGLEVIGNPNVDADVSVIYATSMYLDRVGLEHYYVVNNVAILRTFLTKLNIVEDEQNLILHLIDKEMIQDALKAVESRAGETGVEIVSRIINLSMDGVEGAVDEYKYLLDSDYVKLLEEIDKLRVLVDQIKGLGYRVEFSPNLVRGLAYYSGLIYECKTPRIKQSIAGGGRYDGLTKVYGGEFEYSTGIALGMDRVALALTEGGSVGRFIENHVLVVSLENTPLGYSYVVLRKLNKEGISGWVYRTDNLSKALSLAIKHSFRAVAIIGGRECVENKVTIKNLETGEQATVSVDDAANYVRNMLIKPSIKF